jgi:hypothetical protein
VLLGYPRLAELPSCRAAELPSCRAAEIHFALPVHHYLHIVAGIVEFGAITLALHFSLQRTRGSQSWIARSYRLVWRCSFIAYPLLGLAYVTNELGGVMEGLFFVGFSIFITVLNADWITGLLRV